MEALRPHVQPGHDAGRHPGRPQNGNEVRQCPPGKLLRDHPLHAGEQHGDSLRREESSLANSGPRSGREHASGDVRLPPGVLDGGRHEPSEPARFPNRIYTPQAAGHAEPRRSSPSRPVLLGRGPRLPHGKHSHGVGWSRRLRCGGPRTRDGRRDLQARDGRGRGR